MIHFELVTLEGTKFSDDVYDIVLPTPQGYIGIFPHHIPLISLASPGIISVRRNQHDRDDQREYFATNGGAIEILDNVVRVLVDEADHDTEISEQGAKDAFERAKKMKDEAEDQLSLDRAQAMIDRQAVRLKVADLKRKRKR